MINYMKTLQIKLSIENQYGLITYDYPYPYNNIFPFNLGLFKDSAISWLVKSTSAISFTIRSNRERLPCYAPLPPDLMNIFSKKMEGKKCKNFA